MNGCSGSCQQGRQCGCAPEGYPSAARGIVFGLLFSLPIWLVILLLAFWR